MDEWTRELTEMVDSKQIRDRAMPSWVRSVYTTVPCTMTPDKEVALLIEFLSRFGEMFVNPLTVIRQELEDKGANVDREYILNCLLDRLRAGDKESLAECQIISQWFDRYTNTNT